MTKYKNQKKKWSEKDLKKLVKYAEFKSCYEIAIDLGRTPSSVKKKLVEEFGTYSFFRISDTISLRALADIMGYAQTKIANWVEKHGLPVRQIHKIGKHGHYRGVVFDDFLVWLEENHKNITIDFGRVNSELFPITMPAWLKQEVYAKNRYGVIKGWSSEEEALLSLYYLGYNYSAEKISSLIGKTVIAVNMKIRRSGLENKKWEAKFRNDKKA